MKRFTFLIIVVIAIIMMMTTGITAATPQKSQAQQATTIIPAEKNQVQDETAAIEKDVKTAIRAISAVSTETAKIADAIIEKDAKTAIQTSAAVSVTETDAKKMKTDSLKFLTADATTMNAEILAKDVKTEKAATILKCPALTTAATSWHAVTT